MKTRILLLALVAGALGACTTVPTVSPAQPHGLIVMHNSVGVGDIHPASVAMIDGVNVPSGRQSFPLAPGEHTLRIVGLMNQAHLRSPNMDLPAYTRGRPRAYELKLDVEEGQRYVIAARFNGPTANDWEPVVLRTEPITR